MAVVYAACRSSFIVLSCTHFALGPAIGQNEVRCYQGTRLSTAKSLYSKAHRTSKFVYYVSVFTLLRLNSIHALMIGTAVCLYYILSFYYIRVYYEGVLLYTQNVCGDHWKVFVCRLELLLLAKACKEGFLALFGVCDGRLNRGVD